MTGCFFHGQRREVVVGKPIATLFCLLFSFQASAESSHRKPSQADESFTISNEGVYVGDLDCSNGLISAKVLVNSLGQKALVSDLNVQGKIITLKQVQAFELDDSFLRIKAPGLLVKAKIPERNGIGLRRGQIVLHGKKQEGSCLVPEVSDLSM